MSTSFGLGLIVKFPNTTAFAFGIKKLDILLLAFMSLSLVKIY
jgi:hypothetical protein